MNPPTVVHPDARKPARIPLGPGLAVAALALATVAALAFLVDLSARPATVPRLTFENPTEYALSIEVSPGTGTDWTSAGFVAQRATAVVEEVIDQGDVWVFRFHGQGEPGGELRLTRAELEASNWKVIVPAEVGRRLAEAGAPPTP